MYQLLSTLGFLSQIVIGAPFPVSQHGGPSIHFSISFSEYRHLDTCRQTGNALLNGNIKENFVTGGAHAGAANTSWRGNH